MIDRATHHTSLPVVIARVQDGVFRTVKALPAVPGDPYLARARTPAATPILRVVS
jgi:branched-chain amino acid transport system substrate-binding protein